MENSIFGGKVPRDQFKPPHDPEMAECAGRTSVGMLQPALAHCCGGPGLLQARHRLDAVDLRSLQPRKLGNLLKISARISPAFFLYDRRICTMVSRFNYVPRQAILRPQSRSCR